MPAVGAHPFGSFPVVQTAILLAVSAVVIITPRTTACIVIQVLGHPDLVSNCNNFIHFAIPFINKAFGYVKRPSSFATLRNYYGFFNHFFAVYEFYIVAAKTKGGGVGCGANLCAVYVKFGSARVAYKGYFFAIGQGFINC